MISFSSVIPRYFDVEVLLNSKCFQMEKVAASVERLGNKDVSLEFERINKALKETNQIGTEVTT